MKLTTILLSLLFLYVGDTNAQIDFLHGEDWTAAQER